ncbi:MAG: hypothetical protein J2P23_12990 [Microlunatus sp.]|nr:hypothetical protein [Microlunatus sp.]
MNSTVEAVVQEDMTSAVTIPVGLPGINTFSTPDWWNRAESRPGSGATQHRVDDPGAAVVLTPDPDAPATPAVLMITRPLVDWLPVGAPDAAEDLAARLTEWADAVLAWTAVAPVHLVITRADPKSVSDLRAAAAGRWVVDSAHRDLSPEAEAFAAAMQGWLRERRGSAADLDRTRSGAALDAVAMATDLRSGGYDDALRAASIDVPERLSSAGVHIHGPRTGLVWPQAPGPELSVDVAAEASLAVLLAALEDPGRTTAESPELQADTALWAGQRKVAQRELSGRRVDPRNLRRIPLRGLLKLLLLGRRHD